MKRKLRFRLIKWLIGPLFYQSPYHFQNTVELFRLIRAEWAAEFTEDNRATRNNCIRECFDTSEI